jgi:hypothetical protein
MVRSTGSRFCKPLVGSSNLSPGTKLSNLSHWIFQFGMAWDRAIFMSRHVANILVVFQRLPLTYGSSMQHSRDMDDDDEIAKRIRQGRRLRTFTETEWARLPPAARAYYNHLRQRGFLSAKPSPAVDLSPKPPKLTPKLLDPSPLAREVARTGDPALFEELKAATASLLSAADGDARMLEERLGKGIATPEERRLAADPEAPRRGGRRAGKRGRPPTWHRKERLDAAGRYLHAWFHAEPEQRGSQNEAIRLCVRKYHIARSDGFDLLSRIKAKVAR